MNNSIKTLKELGYTDNSIKKILNQQLLSVLSDDKVKYNILIVFKELLKEGFNKEDIIKLTSYFPAMFIYSPKNLNSKYTYIYNIFKDKNTTINTLKKCPQLYSYKIESIKEKNNELIKLGFTEDNIVKMFKSFPTMYNYDILNVKEKFNILNKFNYSNEEIIKMINNFPGIIGFNNDTLKEKLDFYNKNDMYKYLINKPTILIQNLELTKNRYNYIKDNKIDLTTFDKLFISNKRFNQRFKITKDELTTSKTK